MAMLRLGTFSRHVVSGRRFCGGAATACGVAGLVAARPALAACKSAEAAGAPGRWESLTPVEPGGIPVTYDRIDHIVLRCRDVQGMVDFYVGVLGATPEWMGRLCGCLSHMRIGGSLIDLQAYRAPVGHKIHAGGTGFTFGVELLWTSSLMSSFQREIGVSCEDAASDQVTYLTTHIGQETYQRRSL